MLCLILQGVIVNQFSNWQTFWTSVQVPLLVSSSLYSNRIQSWNVTALNVKVIRYLKQLQSRLNGTFHTYTFYTTILLSPSLTNVLQDHCPQNLMLTHRIFEILTSTYGPGYAPGPYGPVPLTILKNVLSLICSRAILKSTLLQEHITNMLPEQCAF